MADFLDKDSPMCRYYREAAIILSNKDIKKGTWAATFQGRISNGRILKSLTLQDEPKCSVSIES